MSGKLIVEVVSASVGKDGSKLWDKLEQASIKGANAARGVARQRRMGCTGSLLPAAARRAAASGAWRELRRVLRRAVELRDGNELQKVRCAVGTARQSAAEN